VSAAEKLKGERRVVAELPDDVHRKLRLRCVDQGITIRACLIELISGAEW
jgi:hypothetical protein